MFSSTFQEIKKTEFRQLTELSHPWFVSTEQNIWPHAVFTSEAINVPRIAGQIFPVFPEKRLEMKV